MKKFVSQGLLILVGASVFFLPNLSDKLKLSQTSTSPEYTVTSPEAPTSPEVTPVSCGTIAYGNKIVTGRVIIKSC